MADPGLAVMQLREREDLLKWSEASAASNQPLFSVLYREIANDDDLFELSLQAPAEQLSGKLLLSAVHFLMLKSPDHELAAYFASINADPPPAAAAAVPFRAFCRENRDELADMVRSRTLQTTSPERAPQLLLALDHVSKVIDEPFSIVEVGCSAGLLLLFDHYRYRFPNGHSLGNAQARVAVPVELVGDRTPVPTAFPQIVHRVGLDLNPVDVTDIDARNWILGCSAADRIGDFKDLRAALEYRASVPLNVVAGDALETLPLALDDIEGPVCVFHSRCLYQWPSAAQEAFSATLKRLSRGGVIHRIGIESETAGIGRHEICHTIYRDGESATHLLGQVPGKNRIEWLA